jgi:hypothetical protein
VYSPFGVSFQEMLSSYWSCSSMFATIFQNGAFWPSPSDGGASCEQESILFVARCRCARPYLLRWNPLMPKPKQAKGNWGPGCQGCRAPSVVSFLTFHFPPEITLSPTERKHLRILSISPKTTAEGFIIVSR